MRFNFGAGEISFRHLCAAFFLAKTISILAFFSLENFLQLNGNLSTFISRCLELSVFLSLVIANFLPRKFPLSAIFHTRQPQANKTFFLQVAITIVLAMSSRYAIELVRVVLSAILELGISQHSGQMTASSEVSYAPSSMRGEAVLAKITIGPFVEEVIYRGVLLNFLLARFGTVTALVASSLAFAALHGDLLTAFLGGLVFAHIYIFTRNIWLCTLAHSVANITAVFMNRFGDYIYPRFRYGDSPEVGFLICCAAACAWLASLILITIRSRRMNTSSIFLG